MINDYELVFITLVTCVVIKCYSKVEIRELIFDISRNPDVEFGNFMRSLFLVGIEMSKFSFYLDVL